MVAIKERIDIDIKQVLSNLGYNNVHKLPAAVENSEAMVRKK
jgi:hypothetical protein